MDSSRRPRLSRLGAAATLAAFILLGLLPGEAHGADGMTNTATTTYELLPAQGLVRVTVDFRVENHISSKVHRYACTQNAVDPYFGSYTFQTTCTTTTTYYLNYTTAWIEDAATQMKVTADSGSVSTRVDKRQPGYKLVRFMYRPVFRNQVRKVHLTYVLPGAKPRSTSPIRAGAAYASFCAEGVGIDGGSVRIIVPSNFSFDVTGDTLTPTPYGTRTIYSTGHLTQPYNFFACFTGSNDAALKTTPLRSDKGRDLRIEAWPEDATWDSEVRSRVEDSVADLETLLGGSLPGAGTLHIRETSAVDLGNYVGKFNPGTQIVRLSEDGADDDTIAHELAHAWFNGALFFDTWLGEGYAEWAARTVHPNTLDACSEPATYPGTGKPALRVWTYVSPKATTAEKNVVAFNYDASCYVITRLSDEMGTDNMRDALQYLFLRKVPYLPNSTERLSAGPVSVHEWVDVMEEVGLAGRDVDVASKLLTDYGIETDAAALATRTDARKAYHAFLSNSGWSVPSFVAHEMADWKFDDATAALTVATAARQAAAKADAALPGIEAAEGPVKAHAEAASSLEQLQEVQRLAERQLAAAKVVGPAIAAASAPLNPVDAIGLLGFDRTALAREAFAAIKSADTELATADAARLTDELAGATTSGAIRIGLAVFAVIGLAIAVMLARGGRRERRRVAPVAGPSMGMSASDESPTEVLPVVTDAGWSADPPATPPPVLPPAPEG